MTASGHSRRDATLAPPAGRTNSLKCRRFTLGRHREFGQNRDNSIAFVVTKAIYLILVWIF
jgi:hypothetical protein